MEGQLYSKKQKECLQRLGTEMCRGAIACRWYFNGLENFGESNFIFSVLLATISGSFGSVIGTLSLAPVTSRLTRTLFVGMLLFHYLQRTNPSKETFHRALVPIWMLMSQYAIPL